MGNLNKDSASALIGGLGNLVGSLVGGKMSEDSSMKMAKYMNEYNKPANQIKRLKEAGINPALALSQSLDASVGNMDSSPKPADFSNLGSIGSAAASAELAAAQSRLADAQAYKVGKEAGLVDVQTEAQRINNEFLPKLLNSQLNLNEKDALLKEATKDLTEEDANKVREEINNIVKQRDIMDRQLDEYVEVIRKVKSEANIAAMREKLTPQMLEAELSKVISDRNASVALATQLSELARNIRKDTDIKELQRQAQDIITQGVQKYGLKNAKYEAYTNRAIAASASMDMLKQSKGQGVAEFLSPVGSVFAVFGSALGNASSAGGSIAAAAMKP